MLVVKVDNFHAKPAQTSFACFAHVVRLPVDTAKPRLFWVAQNSKLRGNDNLFAMTFQCTAEQFFIGMWPVHVGGVEECDAQFKRPMDCRDRFLVVASAVKIGHAHATKSQGGNNRAAASKFALLHICPIQVCGAYSSQRCRIA